VQAIDLVGRKVPMQGGQVMRDLIAEIASTAGTLDRTAGLESVGARLSAGAAALERATNWVLGNGGPPALAAATPYLKLAGDVVGGWMLGKQALAAADSDDPWLQSKGALARLYASQVLAQAGGLADGVCAGPEDLEATPAAALAG
jgi:hypothetical protein